MPPRVGNPREIEPRDETGNGYPLCLFATPGDNETQCLLESTILARRAKLNHPEQVEERRPVALEVVPDESEEVVARMGGVRVALLDDLLRPIADDSFDGRHALVGRTVATVCDDDLAKRRYERIGPLPVFLSIQFEGVTAPFVNLAHPLDEHLDDVVRRRRGLIGEEGRRERVPLVRLEGLHTTGIKSPRLHRKVLEFRVRKMRQSSSPDVFGRNDRQASNEFAQMRERRGSRFDLQAVPKRVPCGRVQDEERIDAGLLLVAERTSDSLANRPGYGCPNPTRRPHQRVECRKLESSTYKLLDADVD